MVIPHLRLLGSKIGSSNAPPRFDEDVSSFSPHQVPFLVPLAPLIPLAPQAPLVPLVTLAPLEPPVPTVLAYICLHTHLDLMRVTGQTWPYVHRHVVTFFAHYSHVPSCAHYWFSRIFSKIFRTNLSQSFIRSL